MFFFKPLLKMKNEKRVINTSPTQMPFLSKVLFRFHNF